MAISKTIKDGKTVYRGIISYKNHDGKYKSLTSKWFKTKKEAQNWVDLNKDEMSDQSVTFYKAYQSWLAEAVRQNDKPKTIKDKRRNIDIYLKPLFDKKIEKIKVKEVMTILNKNERFQKLGTERKNRVLLWGGSIFRHSKLHYNTTNNPFELIHRYKPTNSEKMKTYNVYTVDQFNKFIGYIPPQYKEYANFYTLLFYTGCRLNELRSLTFSKISGNKIKIDRQLEQSGKSFTTVKTKAGNRSIAIPPHCVKILNEQRNLYNDMPSFNNEWFVFGGFNPLTIRTIERIKLDVIREHNLPYIRLHDLRHSHASYLIEQGVNIYKISKRLGHTSISITLDRYGHLLDRDEDEILAVL